MAMECTPNSPMQPSTGCEKVKCIFLYQKRTKNRFTAVFSDSMSRETPKLVASNVFLLKAMDFTPKNPNYQNAAFLLQVRKSI